MKVKVRKSNLKICISIHVYGGWNCYVINTFLVVDGTWERDFLNYLDIQYIFPCYFHIFFPS